MSSWLTVVRAAGGPAVELHQATLIHAVFGAAYPLGLLVAHRGAVQGRGSAAPEHVGVDHLDHLGMAEPVSTGWGLRRTSWPRPASPLPSYRRGVPRSRGTPARPRPRWKLPRRRPGPSGARPPHRPGGWPWRSRRARSWSRTWGWLSPPMVPRTSATTHRYPSPARRQGVRRAASRCQLARVAGLEREADAAIVQEDARRRLDDVGSPRPRRSTGSASRPSARRRPRSRRWCPPPTPRGAWLPRRRGVDDRSPGRQPLRRQQGGTVGAVEQLGATVGAGHACGLGEEMRPSGSSGSSGRGRPSEIQAPASVR